MTVPEDPNSPNNELKDIETGKSEASRTVPKDSYSLTNKIKASKARKMSKDPNYLANKLEDTKIGKASKDPNFPAN